MCPLGDGTGAVIDFCWGWKMWLLHQSHPRCPTVEGKARAAVRGPSSVSEQLKTDMQPDEKPRMDTVMLPSSCPGYQGSNTHFPDPGRLLPIPSYEFCLVHTRTGLCLDTIFFHSCFAPYFARSIFFYYHYYYFVPLRLFFSSLSQAVLNRLELFRIYMIILRSADGKQSHVVLGIFLTCSKKCISPLWSYRQSHLHRWMMSDSPCPSSQRKFVQELETEPLCYKSQCQNQKSVLPQSLLIDIISLHGGLFWITGMGLKYFHVGFHPASLR